MNPTQPLSAPPELRTDSLLDRIAEETQRTATRYMPTLSVKQFTEREHMLRELKALLVDGIDYGVVPGTNDKPVLLKPGAEKLCAFFGYAPHYSADIIEDWDGKLYGEPLFYYKYTCVLSKDGKPVGEGQGSCNSWETKYRYRQAGRKCPACGMATIIKGKDQYGGGWLCFAKKGGCGAKYKDKDPAIEGQEVGRIANPDFADLINTIQKMGQKRSMVAAVLSATGASQYFTQDMEDASESPETPEAKHKAGNTGETKVESSHRSAPQQRHVPEELMIVIDKLRGGDFSEVQRAKDYLRSECVAAGIETAFTNREHGLRASYPKGVPKSAVEAFFLDLWDFLETAKLAKIASDAGAPGAENKSDWVPDGLFPEEATK